MDTNTAIFILFVIFIFAALIAAPVMRIWQSRTVPTSYSCASSSSDYSGGSSSSDSGSSSCGGGCD